MSSDSFRIYPLADNLSESTVQKPPPSNLVRSPAVLDFRLSGLPRSISTNNIRAFEDTSSKVKTKFTEIISKTTHSVVENKSANSVSVFPAAGYFPLLQNNLPLIFPQKSDSFSSDSPGSASSSGSSSASSKSGSPTSASPKKGILKTSPTYFPRTVSPLNSSPETPSPLARRVQFPGLTIQTTETLILENNKKQALHLKLEKEIATINKLLSSILLYETFTSQGFITHRNSASPYTSFAKQIAKHVPGYCNQELEWLNPGSSQKRLKRANAIKKLKTVTQTLLSQQAVALTPQDLYSILNKRLKKAEKAFERIHLKLQCEPHLGELFADSTDFEKLEPILIRRVNFIFQEKFFSSINGTRRPKTNPAYAKDVTKDISRFLDSFGKYLTRCVFLSWMEDEHLFAFCKKAPNITELEIQEMLPGTLSEISTLLRYRSLSSFQKLTDLHYNSTSLANESFLKLISNYCKQLTTLTIQFNSYDLLHEMPIQSLSTCFQLQSLTLCGSISLLREQIETLTCCKALQILQITHNHEFTDEEMKGLEHLGPQLRKLVLHSCSSIKAKNIGSFKFDTLEQAEISHCKIIHPSVIGVVGKIQTLAKLILISNAQFAAPHFNDLKPADGLTDLTLGFKFRLTNETLHQFFTHTKLTRLVMPNTGFPFEKDSTLANEFWEELKQREEKGNPLTIELFDYEEPGELIRDIIPFIPKSAESSDDGSSESTSTGDDSEPDEVDRNQPRYNKHWSFTAEGSREV